MLFLVCALGIVAGVLLLPVIWNLKKVVGVLRPLLETNQEYINKAMKTLPGTFENMGQISINVRETTDKLKISLPVILQDVEYTTNSAKGSAQLAGVVMENLSSGINETVADYRNNSQGIMAYIHFFKEVVQIIYRTFSSSK